MKFQSQPHTNLPSPVVVVRTARLTASKLLELWRYEQGISILPLIGRFDWPLPAAANHRIRGFISTHFNDLMMGTLVGLEKTIWENSLAFINFDDRSRQNGFSNREILVLGHGRTMPFQRHLDPRASLTDAPQFLRIAAPFPFERGLFLPRRGNHFLLSCN